MDVGYEVVVDDKWNASIYAPGHNNPTCKIFFILSNHLDDFLDEYCEKVRWKPEDGQLYYYFLPYGVISNSTFINSAFDKEYYNFGNMFKTQEDAEEAKDKIKDLLLNLNQHV